MTEGGNQMEDQNKLPPGFENPTDLPDSTEEAARWQEANRGWWESHPMRYDWKDEIPAEPHSREFYQEIDSRFFSASREFMPWKKTPFDALIDFEALKELDVLEIGVGNGSHAQLLSGSAKSYTGIDITDYAVSSTSKRLNIFDIPAKIVRMDAEQMDFPDGVFDFIWTWGVIHHSSNTPQIVRQMGRVLRPGGRVVTMVYYRSWWSYYVMGFLFSLKSGNLWRRGSIHASVQRLTDGAMARYYSIREWKDLFSGQFAVRDIFVCGPKTDVVLLPSGKLKNLMLQLIPDAVGRILARQCRMGSFLVCIATKKE
jgi:ubiquinone/menaquinone biosynthesis C-methylase UbiE